MSVSYKSVPWFNAEEWRNVYELLFSPTSNEYSKKQALQILLIWKARCTILPSGIESTLGLLEVELNTGDMLRDCDISSDRVARLMYSSVIMRFINHALDDAPFKGQTLLQAASAMNIPEWIVNLRHETAHGHELPSLSLLKSAAFCAMNWLFDKYWLPQNNNIQDYVLHQYLDNDGEQDLGSLVNNYMLLAIFSYEKFNVCTIDDISDEEIKQDIFDFVCQRIVKSKVGVHWEMTIFSIIRKILKEISHTLNSTKNDGLNVCMAKILTDKESLFLMANLDFNESPLQSSNFLPDWFVNVFEPLLTLLHKKSIIHTLIKALFDIVNDSGENSERHLRASQWIREISIGLYKSKLCIPLAEKYNIERNSKKSKEAILLKFNRHHSDRKNGLTLDLLSDIPDEICSKQFIIENLSQYNQYTNLYLEEFLMLSEHVVSNNVVNDIVCLVNIMNSRSDNEANNMELASNIRTVADLIDSSEGICNSNAPVSEDNSNIFTASKWEYATFNNDWKNCPLGILPWQLHKSVNPSLPMI